MVYFILVREIPVFKANSVNSEQTPHTVSSDTSLLVAIIIVIFIKNERAKLVKNKKKTEKEKGKVK